ncbi:hydantoinase/oxoprolinase family protein [Actinospica sp. MGRD01-02]|uniref:Hydantoinase/oxoprolinase family protein n=1 Tax=Actinospica acidithermotolerans TaxID=2828514 RepID=A0A941IED7_9ACTN|nr:hydantoinase/oxoprolinase family protein [Actinospica acidithermotolerans]MBR7825105.1 hydantoinase/oxoprolinase family protein [Actinospica acidithermotolerans]
MTETIATCTIGVDVGGTFTDLVLHDAARATTRTGKLLTTPQDPSRAIIDGIRRLLDEAGVPIERVAAIVHGTTLITNTVLERTGAKVGLITTEGFRDILEMGRETRHDTDDLYARPAPVIVPRHLRIGVPERICADGTELVPLDESAVLKAAHELVEEHGVEAFAISFLHSYADPSHERFAYELIRFAYPNMPISLSSDVAPEIGEYERTNTACVNAYVQPVVSAYLDRLEERLHGLGFAGTLTLMLSSGGLTTLEHAKAFPVKLLESGPAAGAIAAAHLAELAGEDQVIAFDMGGTTAKMSVVERGLPHIKHEFEAGRLDRFKPGSGLPLKLAVVDMIEIGAGGGSIASRDEFGLLKVGPRSAGSEPGPVAYGRGGTSPTVTDADLLTGHLDPDNFLGGELTLGLPKVREAFERLAESLGLDAERTASGALEIVTENMAAATRVHLSEKGRDPRAYALMAFGGAGPVHAYTLAKSLKMSRLIVPMGAGVLSAYGFLVADPAVEDVRGYATPLGDADWAKVGELYREMESHATSLLSGAASAGTEIARSRSVDMRYLGQGFEITVPMPGGRLSAASAGRLSEELRHRFTREYAAVFGRALPEGTPEVTNWRLTSTVPKAVPSLTDASHEQGGDSDDNDRGAWRGKRSVLISGFGIREADVYDRRALAPGSSLRGPAVFEEHETSCAIGPDAVAFVDAHRNLVIDIDYATRIDQGVNS